MHMYMNGSLFACRIIMHDTIFRNWRENWVR